MEPRVVQLSEIIVVGTEYIGENANGEIPEMLDKEFYPRMDEIPNRVAPNIFFGLCSSIQGRSRGVFSYLACQEVSCCDEMPGGMVQRTIPANSYAVFTHRGSLEALADTWAYITKVWLPKSGYKMAGEYAFEYYDERFDDFSEKSELDIYVPVKPK